MKTLSRLGLVLLVTVAPSRAATLISAAKPLKGLAEFKQRWEVGWSADWKLVEAKEADIDEFMAGYTLVWSRDDGGLRRIRTDSFTTDWRFYSAHEELLQAGRPISRGPVIITPDGNELFWAPAILGKPKRVGTIDDYEILYYEIHLLTRQDAGCVYRSAHNFGVAQAGEFRGLSRVPDDTRQVAGGACPAPETLRKNPFQQRLPAT